MERLDEREWDGGAAGSGSAQVPNQQLPARSAVMAFCRFTRPFA